MVKSHWIVTFVFFLLHCSGATASETIQLLTFKTHSRLIIKIDKSVPITWKNEKDGFEIHLKGINFNDLGASIGEENAWKKRVETLHDARVETLEIAESKNGVKIRGRWQFPEGELELAHPAMDIFDFHQKGPSPQHAFDFWLKESLTIAEEKELRLRNKPKDDLIAAKKMNAKKAARKLASQNTAPAPQLLQVCGQKLTDRNEVFLEFKPVHQKVDFSRWLPSNTADQDFIYHKPKKRNKESQYVRLAIDLADLGKWALALRALDFMNEEFPLSSYGYEMKFLRANILIKLGFRPDGERLLQELVAEAKSSRVALKSALYLAARQVERNMPLMALESFLWLIQNYPHSELIWLFHLGAAESLYSLKYVERGLKEYEWIIEHGSTTAVKAEAAYRMGDLYLLHPQYDMALGSYFHALEYFKSESKRFPAYFLNRGESYYQLGKFEEAKTVFEKFLDDYPTHPQGWRATFRLGEISARTASSDKDREQSRKWFYDTINRYPTSPGVVLSRIRLASCGDHGGLNFEAQDKFFQLEARNYTGDDQVRMERYVDFTALAHARTVISLGNSVQSIESAIEEMRRARTLATRKELATVARQLLAKVILELLSQGKKYEALSFYSEKAPKIPETEEVGNIDFLLALSRAASDQGLGRYAAELTAAHQRLSKRVPQPIPSALADSMDLENQIKTSEKNYTEAEALWVSSRVAKGKVDSARLRALLGEVDDHSEYSYQKYVILGMLAESEGNFQQALTHAAHAQLLTKSLRIKNWLASLQLKLKDYNSSLNIYHELEQAVVLNKSNESDRQDVDNLLGVPPTPELDEIIFAQGEILEKNNRWGEVASTYSRAIQNGWGGDRMVYEYARSLLKTGNPRKQAKAEEVLNKLVTGKPKQEKDVMWKKLAESALANVRERELFNQRAKEGRK